MKVRRIHDATLINGLARHPDIYPGIGDDYAVPAIDFNVQAVMGQFVWLVPFMNEQPMGFTAFQPLNRTTLSYHGGFLPFYRGKQAVAAGRMMFDYVFHLEHVEKLVTFTPDTNRTAKRMNALLGMKREGLLSNAQMMGGNLVDMVVYGMTVEEFENGC